MMDLPEKIVRLDFTSEYEKAGIPVDDNSRYRWWTCEKGIDKDHLNTVTYSQSENRDNMTPSYIATQYAGIRPALVLDLHKVDFADNTFTLKNSRNNPAPHKHDLMKVSKKKATCTKDGYKAFWICMDPECGCMFSDKSGGNEYWIRSPERIPAAGHKWNKGKVTRKPTLLKKGKVTYKCKKCGAKKTELITYKEWKKRFGKK